MKLFSKSKKDIGAVGERAAARYLRRSGYRVLARNCHCGKNELDLVVRDRRYIAFVEVKTRSFDDPTTAQFRPCAAVDIGKRRRTVQAAAQYLRLHPTSLCPRLDVVEVYLDRKRYKPFKIHHIPAAFSADGKIQ